MDTCHAWKDIRPLTNKHSYTIHPDPTGSQPFHEEGTARKTFGELPISKVTLRGLNAVSIIQCIGVEGDGMGRPPAALTRQSIYRLT